MSVQSAAALPGDFATDCDVVVVGSGAGGAVVAKELAEAGLQVVVLEEGPHVAPQEYTAMRPSQVLRRLWREAGMSFALGIGESPMINVMMGRCVGGSSVLTGGVCFRAPGSVLDVWCRERGLDELSAEGLDRHYAAVEKALGVREVPSSLRSRSAELFALGAERRGFQVKSLRRNIGDCTGLSRCNFGCPRHAKTSVDLSYLPQAIGRGVRVFSDCLVEKVLVRSDRAVGVLARALGPGGKKGRKVRVRAHRVVVAAGAYHTPLLLQRSGLGRVSDHLGAHLTLHPSFRVMARFDEPVEGWRGALQSIYVDDLEHQRITLVNMFTPPGVLAATMPGFGPAHVRRAREIPHLAMFGGLIHDQGGGRVTGAPGREPLVTYRMAPEDRAAIPKAMRAMAEIYFAAGAKEVFLPVLGLESVTADQFASLDLEHVSPKRVESGSQHPLGSCRMGTSPGNSVVDPNGQTWEVQNLYVADGSIIPTSLGVNPQLTVMAMATRIAWKLRELPRA